MVEGGAEGDERKDPGGRGGAAEELRESVAWRVGTKRRARLVRVAYRQGGAEGPRLIIAVLSVPCAPTQEEEKELPHFWFPYPGDGYALGEVLHHDQDTDNMNVRLKLEAGPKVRTRRPVLGLVHERCVFGPGPVCARVRRTPTSTTLWRSQSTRPTSTESATTRS